MAAKVNSLIKYLRVKVERYISAADFSGAKDMNHIKSITTSPHPRSCFAN
jgi:hypothetical protein